MGSNGVTLNALQKFRSKTETIKNIDKPIKGVRAPSIMPIYIFKSELARFRKCSWNSVVSLWHIGCFSVCVCVCLYVRRRIKKYKLFSQFTGFIVVIWKRRQQQRNLENFYVAVKVYACGNLYNLYCRLMCWSSRFGNINALQFDWFNKLNLQITSHKINAFQIIYLCLLWYYYVLTKLISKLDDI